MYYAFIDLQKVFDRVLREVIRCALRKEEWLVETVVALYEEAETAVRTADGIIDWFNVLVGLHQWSVLSPLLFITVMEAIRPALAFRMI